MDSMITNQINKQDVCIIRQTKMNAICIQYQYEFKYLWIRCLEYVRKTMDFKMYTLGYRNRYFLKGNVVLVNVFFYNPWKWSNPNTKACAE